MNYHCENCGWLNCHFDVRPEIDLFASLWGKTSILIVIFTIMAAFAGGLAGWGS